MLPAREMVILLHGMGRTRRSMLPLARALAAAGYVIHNETYPSRSRGVAELGPMVAGWIAAAERDMAPARVHLVGHSLGCILIRWVLAHRPPRRPGRVVMLGPPNRGARAADLTVRAFSWHLKPLRDLTTSPAGTARTIPPVPGIEIGIVAGSRDRLVSVPETHLNGQTAHVVVPCGHTLMILRRDVFRLVLAFLRTGRFDSA